MLIDTHCHLCNLKLKKNINNVLKNAAACGVDYMCDVGYDDKTISCVSQHINKFQNVYGIIGVHPHISKDYNLLIENKIVKIIKENEKIIGLGEIGLDFFHNFSEPSVQRSVFIRQLRLAKQLEMPVIIHSRDSLDEVISIICDEGPFPARGIIHCFSGTLEQAKKVINFGFFISIGGSVTYRSNKELHKVIREIALENILVETDSPYLPPAQKQGMPNEPANILFVVRKIAALKLMTTDDVKRITSYNAKRLFSYRNPNVFPSLKPNEAKIVYFIGNKMYLNITNRCTNRCVFCVRNTSDFINNHYLRLSHKLNYDEIINALPRNLDKYEEIVFCGFGEPTIRLDILTRVAHFLKENGAKRIRLDTNGTANLYNKRDVIPELAENIDTVSISLNAHNRMVYNKICKPLLGDGTYSAVLAFIGQSKKHFKNVVVTALDLPEVDIEKCKEIAEKSNVDFRVRHYSTTG